MNDGLYFGHQIATFKNLSVHYFEIPINSTDISNIQTIQVIIKSDYKFLKD